MKVSAVAAASVFAICVVSAAGCPFANTPGLDGGDLPQDAGTGGQQDAGTGGQQDAGDVACGSGPSWNGFDYQGSQDARFVFQADNPSVEIAFTRTYLESGVGESSIFEVTDFQVITADVETCVEDVSSITYGNTHHNWYDTFDVVVDETTWHFEWQFDLEWTVDPFQYEVSASNASGEVYPATLLRRVEGPIWP